MAHVVNGKYWQAVKYIARNHEICAVFFGLQKAFDSVLHQALLAKLHSFGHVNNYLLNWICHCLLDHKQYVVLNDACSGSSAVVSGVPQGSVLGPSLFLIYFNSITQVPIGFFLDLAIR